MALSQSWAYGLTLFLPPDSQVVDLPVRPTPADLRAAAVGCDAVALYDDVVWDHPELVDTLRLSGFESVARFAIGNSRAVVVFSRALNGMGAKPGLVSAWLPGSPWERCQAGATRL